MTFKHNQIAPNKVHETLAKHMLVDGFPLTLDMKRSHGSRLVCANTGKEYLDFFSFFASSPLGFNHPNLNTYEVESRLLEAAKTKISNSDIYSTHMAEFVDALERTAGSVYKSDQYYFFISGGALAVDNACKTAFDILARRNGWRPDQHHQIDKMQIMHLTNAFHGRSGFALGMTNTDPNKTNYFPVFRHWTRIDSPYIRSTELETAERECAALDQMDFAFRRNKGYIAAVCLEPLQAEGGDLHFRPEFLKEVRALCNRYGACLIFDEVQTFLGTGKWWGWQHHDVEPDITCFAKKMQTGGILVSKKIDEVPDHVFKKSSRINSTFGGCNTDFVRATVMLETVVNENLLANSTERGEQMLQNLKKLVEITDKVHPGVISNARGKGLMCAVDADTNERRDKIIDLCYDNGLIVLPCGSKSVRFRPSLTIDAETVDKGLDVFGKSVIQSMRKE